MTGRRRLKIECRGVNRVQISSRGLRQADLHDMLLLLLILLANCCSLDERKIIKSWHAVQLRKPEDKLTNSNVNCKAMFLHVLHIINIAYGSHVIIIFINLSSQPFFHLTNTLHV